MNKRLLGIFVSIPFFVSFKNLFYTQLSLQFRLTLPIPALGYCYKNPRWDEGF